MVVYQLSVYICANLPDGSQVCGLYSFVLIGVIRGLFLIYVRRVNLPDGRQDCG
jgi:hypothetical protein